MTSARPLARLRLALDTELRASREDRPSGATDASLESADQLVQAADDALAARDVETAARFMTEVARAAIDGWSLTAPLTAEVSACAQRLRDAARKH